MTEIRPVELPGDMRELRRLFREYSQSLDVDLCFQGFDDELAKLPGKYAPLAGRLLLAWGGDRAVGSYNPIPGANYLALDLRPGP